MTRFTLFSSQLLHCCRSTLWHGRYKDYCQFVRLVCANLVTLHVRQRGLEAADAIMIAAFLPRCMALASLNLSGICVGAKGVEALALAISEANGRRMALLVARRPV